MDLEGLEKRINNRGGITYWKDGTMVGKKCSKCGKDKEVSEFRITNKAKNVYRTECKECERDSRKEYYKNNSDKERERRRKYYENNRDKEREYNKQYCENNKERKKEYDKQYYQNNKEHIKQYRETNKEHIKEQKKQYREANKEHIKEQKKQYYKNNVEYIKEKHKQWRENNLDYNKQYYELHKEEIQQYSKCWSKNNSEYLRKYREQWYKENKEYVKDYCKQRYEENKENNILELTETLSKVNPILKGIKAYGSIYKITNIKTNHVYIGQTIRTLSERYGENIIRGWIKERLEKVNQKFTEELIEEDFILEDMIAIGVCEYHLDKLEAYYIDKYDSYNNGYNNQSGNHRTDDGLEEFNKILAENKLQFVNNKLIAK